VLQVKLLPAIVKRVLVLVVCKCYKCVCVCVVGKQDFSLLDDQLFVPSGDSGDEEETIDMEEESAAKVFVLLLLHLYLINC